MESTYSLICIYRHKLHAIPRLVVDERERERESACIRVHLLSLYISHRRATLIIRLRGERFDARPAYQDNGFHRPMVRIYPIRGKGLRLISIASRYPSPADQPAWSLLGSSVGESANLPSFSRSYNGASTVTKIPPFETR